MRPAIFLATLILCGCGTMAQPTRIIAQQTRDWRQVATASDRERLREWRDAFVDALAAARAAGHGPDLEREGPLLEPDAAVGGEPIPEGLYRCRVIKVGAKSEGVLNYVSYPAFTCRVSSTGRGRNFVKLTGSQRHVGVIFANDALRQVFLGTLALGDEQGAMQYGVDEMRNVAGYIERIGPNRWRLVMPRPHFESQLDVMELVPA